MKKSELIKLIAKEYPFLRLIQVEQVVDLVFEEIINGLKAGKRVEIRGLGSFSLKSRKVQLDFPSKDQNTINLTDRNTIYFRMGKEFFDRLNASNEK
jgi:integration host factor subunit beta